MYVLLYSCSFVLFWIWGQFPISQGLIFGGGTDTTEEFCVMSLGGLYLEGLIHGGAYFQNFTGNMTLDSDVRKAAQGFSNRNISGLSGKVRRKSGHVVASYVIVDTILRTSSA